MVPLEAPYPGVYIDIFIFFLRSLWKIIWMNVHYFPNAPRISLSCIDLHDCTCFAWANHNLFDNWNMQLIVVTFDVMSWWGLSVKKLCFLQQYKCSSGLNCVHNHMPSISPLSARLSVVNIFCRAKWLSIYWQNLLGSKYSISSAKIWVFKAIIQQIWPPWFVIGWERLVHWYKGKFELRKCCQGLRCLTNISCHGHVGSQSCVVKP